MPKFTITLSFEFETDEPDAAAEFAQSAADHLMDTFNDDDSITSVSFESSPSL